MSLLSSSKEKDILLDQEAFQQAITKFGDLSIQVQDLRKEIEEMLSTLQKGFDTPAGRKFIQSCQGNLLEPLDRQKAVIDHISETLGQANTAYESVFSEYEQLNGTIQSFES